MRPPQYARDIEPWGNAQAVKAALKRLSPEERARLLAWLCLYYDDAGAMFSPQLSRRVKDAVTDRTHKEAHKSACPSLLGLAAVK